MTLTMKRLAVSCVAGALAVLALAPTARADFGFAEFDGDLSNADGTPATKAAGHPYSFTTRVLLNSHSEAAAPGFPVPDGDPKDIGVDLPPGFVGNPNSTGGKCHLNELVNTTLQCPPISQMGMVKVQLLTNESWAPLYNMVPEYGSPATFGFALPGAPVPVLINPTLRSDGDYGLTASSVNTTQAIAVIGFTVTLWGVPADPSHDIQRCARPNENGGPPECRGENENNPGDSTPHSGGILPVGFLRNPTSCTPAGTGLKFTLRANSWQEPDVFKEADFLTHEPAPSQGTQVGIEDCDLVPFDPLLETQPSAHEAESPTGLGVKLELPDKGIRNPAGTGQSDVKKAIVHLPEGMTINPSQAEGLGVCAPARYAEEELRADPRTGCPSDSKVGSVTVHTPLLEEAINGEVFIAAPHDNPFDSLLALYIILRNEERGILIRQAGRVENDPETGQITAIFDDIPQLPFSSFDFRFREGARAPLVTTPSCGAFTTNAELVPWSAADPDSPTPAEVRPVSSDFQVTAGVGGGPCPSGGTRPFKPGLVAGSLNNNAGSYSPFDLRLFRADGEQEITRFSIELPPGLVGKLAGIPYCPDAAIEAAKLRTGAAEVENPSCPQASEIGHTLVGAGVGSVLTHVPGRVYLAGPYHGATLSVAAITAAKVGPFDLGTVVVRQALKVDPVTAEVSIDAAASDPIPHIIDGIPTHLRDVRVYVDRSEFTLNPTSCVPAEVASTVVGSGLDFGSTLDDQPVDISTRYQAANCLSLGFRPRLSLRLLGSTQRGDHPKLRAALRARPGDANIARAQVTLPKTEILEQSHIRTICTRVQYAAKSCPPGSIYGYAKAWTPLLDEPLEGPVYLRSSNHPLPDLVASLDGQIHIDLSGRIDSVKARIRTTFDAVPDAPVSKFVLTMRGGEKGLLVNTTELCGARPRASVRFDGHNGKARDPRPVVRADCGRGKARKGKRRR